MVVHTVKVRFKTWPKHKRTKSEMHIIPWFERSGLPFLIYSVKKCALYTNINQYDRHCSMMRILYGAHWGLISMFIYVTFVKIAQVHVSQINRCVYATHPRGGSVYARSWDSLLAWGVTGHDIGWREYMIEEWAPGMVIHTSGARCGSCNRKRTKWRPIMPSPAHVHTSMWVCVHLWQGRGGVIGW